MTRAILGTAAATAGWIIAAAWLPVTVGAQTRSIADGLRVNVHGSATHLSGGDAGGAGVRPGLSLAYGNSRFFVAFMTYGRVPADDGELDFQLRHLDAGVRVHLRGPQAALVPFILGAYTWRNADYGEIVFLGDTQTVQVGGAGPTFGAGVSYHVAPRWAVETSVKRTGTPMDRVIANNSIFRHEAAAIRDVSWRLNVGISWWYPRSAQPRGGGP